MIKKLLTLLIGIMLFVPAALAGGPTPKPFVVYINFDGKPVEGVNVDFTCGGMTVTQLTNSLGGVMVNIGDYGHFKDVGGCSILEVYCGSASCRETLNVGDMDCPICEYTYELAEAPPVTCSPCDCSGGGGGSCSYTESRCNDIYPCEDTECKECPITPDCETCEVCPVVEDCEVCETEVCPEVPDESPFSVIISLIFGALIGGGGIYFFKKREATVKNVGIKTYVSTDGKVKVLHRHPGIRGYHNPETSHRVEYEKHPKGEITPLYEKDETGVYKYIEG